MSLQGEDETGVDTQRTAPAQEGAGRSRKEEDILTSLVCECGKGKIILCAVHVLKTMASPAQLKTLPDVNPNVTRWTQRLAQYEKKSRMSKEGK